MSTIKAIVNMGPRDARILDVPYPTLPDDDYILVKATAWAINPGDVHHLDMEADPATAGCHVGWDYAGVVVEVGPAVSKEFKKGDRVAGVSYGHNYLRKTDGAFAEYLTARGDTQLKIPENLTDAEAATQGIAVGTLPQSLYRDLQLPWPTNPAPAPFTLFIYGGSTAMGIQGIQLAKLSGGTVITTASPSNFEYLRSLGADHVLDYRAPDLVQEILDAAGGVPLRYALDCYPSASSASICASILARDGTARYTTLFPGTDKMVKQQNPDVEVLETQAYSHMGMDWQYDGVTTPASADDYARAKKFAPLAEELLATGKLKVPRVFLNRGGKGLEGVMKGLEEVRQNKVSGGKLVYTAE